MDLTTPAVWHFSEDPTITRFEPHVPPTNPDVPPMVWTIDGDHAPLYWFPRDCPWVTFWTADGSPVCVLGPTASRRVHAIEAAWLDRVRSCVLYAYRFDPAPFTPWADADGHQVADDPVEPLGVEPVGDLLARHSEAGIELRIVPSLRRLVEPVVASGYRFSMVRMANAETEPMADLRSVRVVLADDHPIWRSGVRTDLGENFHVVGEASDVDEAIEVIGRTTPDLVVCDLNMPGGGGIKVAKTCGEQAWIVMLTVSEAERDLLDAVAAGAVGYLVKSTPPDELRNGLWRAADGDPVFSPSLASLVLGEFRRLAKASGPVQTLSDREREVLQYVARGHTYREIGGQLFIAEKTVENHVRNILGKLHLNRKQELIRYALDHGIE